MAAFKLNVLADNGDRVDGIKWGQCIAVIAVTNSTAQAGTVLQWAFVTFVHR